MQAMLTNVTDRAFRQAVIWCNLQAPGADYCTLWQVPQGWLLEGTAITVQEDAPVLASYQVRCDVEWRTRRVEVQCSAGSKTANLSLIVDHAGSWRGTAARLSALEGCIDVDLALTPATNTLPIRRLQLGVGQSADATAAWIRFPNLEVQPLFQRYTRLSDYLYHYESSTGFATEIEVDNFGLVVNYKHGWERIATQSR
jgi:uncharacterized protein